MQKRILVRFGDLMLKGKNIGYFIKRIHEHVRLKLKSYNVSFECKHDRIFIDYLEEDEKNIIKELSQIQGIYGYSIVYVSKLDIPSMIQTGIFILDEEATIPMIKIKVESKRSDKSFFLTSQELSKQISGPILGGAKRKYIVDVHNPDEILHIEVHKTRAYFYLKSFKGMGGFPFATGGKGLLMLSGGIDSPVAGYLSLKQGIDVELIHFESTPMTPIESAQKAIDLAKKLCNYTMNRQIKLHLVPFGELHQEVLKTIFDPYIITVMRRMMYRIADKFSKKRKMLAIINGESVGQVASQTLQGMAVSESVTNMLVLRPLITMDKLEIINIAKHIETFDISIIPLQDCCSIYVPKSPATKPMEIYASKYEKTFDYEPLVEQAVHQIITIDVKHDCHITLADYGFTVKEALNNYALEGFETNDYIETKSEV